MSLSDRIRLAEQELAKAEAELERAQEKREQAFLAAKAVYGEILQMPEAEADAALAPFGWQPVASLAHHEQDPMMPGTSFNLILRGGAVTRMDCNNGTTFPLFTFGVRDDFYRYCRPRNWKQPDSES